MPEKCRFRWSKQPISSVGAGGPMQNYEGGVFGGCTSDQTDHAVTVVGYGTDAATGDDDYGVGSFIFHLHLGVDYWKIKNSWGNYWGEQVRITSSLNRSKVE